MMRFDLWVRQGLFAVIGALSLAIAPGAALAETALDTGDTAWMLMSTALVLFMALPGLSLFYAGLTRASSVLSVLMQAFAIACLASVLWFIYGYSLTFSDGGDFNDWIGGFGNLFLSELGRDSLSGTIPESVFVMFQMTFAIIAPVLVIGSFIQRVRFPALLWFAALWLTLVYFPVAHWVWGGGWLGEMGVLEFAGGLVVHMTAGVAGLVTAILIGSRTGFPLRQARPHNLTLTVIGASILWVGWFGFNAGSAVAAGTDAGMAMLVTQIATAVAALTWMVADWVRYGTPKVLGIVTGAIAGLVAITPASGFVGPAGAALIGLAAGFTCFTVTNIVKQNFKLDDSLDVFAVHGIGGALGTILTGVFAAEAFGGAGLHDGSIGEQLVTQGIGVIAVFAWTAVVTAVILKLVGLWTKVRASEEEERMGLDLSQHEESGYHVE
ncbi:MAG: ammonium transporter [Gammaproteobacteria bacterium]|nr:ammonium transporter [Gammaproteobacteria bacterium]MDE0301605.1 ammonium transporter [Gammaproteobacteria bacterium]